jgi:outer membrane lipoprotein-sorting protein
MYVLRARLPDAGKAAAPRPPTTGSAVNLLRRLSLSRLLALCAALVVLGASLTAIALAAGGGPVPGAKSLPAAVHDALAAPAVEGVSANVTLTDHLVEGANLASGGSGGEAGQLSSSPLLSGASGRMWASKDGRVRLELQAEKGDTQILYDGHTVRLYDASTNTLYRYTPPAETGEAEKPEPEGHHEVPSEAKIEEAIANLRKHANVTGPTPTDVGGQPAYTVRVSPNEAGSLFSGVELSWDAVHGVPLRAAVYSTTSPSPVLELAASEVSYGPVDPSVFQFTPPPGVKVQEITTSSTAAKTGAAARRRGGTRRPASASRPKVRTTGHGISSIAIVERTTSSKQHGAPSLPEGLPKVKINGTSATELATPLGTVLSFERAGVRYLLLGSVTPSALEAAARGL